MQKIKLVNGIIEDLIVIEDVRREIENEKKININYFSVSDEVIKSIESKLDSTRTFLEQKKLALRKEIDEKYEKKLSIYDSYKELVVIPFEGDYDEKIETLSPKFKEVGDKVEQFFVPELDRHKIKKLIIDTQKILDDTDYIVIKFYEAKLSMSDAPYSQEYLDEILAKRQVARDKINELKSLIK